MAVRRKINRVIIIGREQAIGSIGISFQNNRISTHWVGEWKFDQHIAFPIPSERGMKYDFIFTGNKIERIAIGLGKGC